MKEREIPVNKYMRPVDTKGKVIPLPDKLTRDTFCYARYDYGEGWFQIKPTTLFPYDGEEYIMAEGGDVAFCVSTGSVEFVSEIPEGSSICKVAKTYQYENKEWGTFVTPICFDGYKKLKYGHVLTILALYGKQIVRLPIIHDASLIRLRDDNYRVEGILETIDLSTLALKDSSDTLK